MCFEGGSGEEEEGGGGKLERLCYLSKETRRTITYKPHVGDYLFGFSKFKNLKVT
jgi:hypothetical protein